MSMDELLNQIIPSQHSIPICKIDLAKGVSRLLICYSDKTIAELCELTNRTLEWFEEYIRIYNAMNEAKNVLALLNNEERLHFIKEVMDDYCQDCGEKLGNNPHLCPKFYNYEIDTI